MRFVVSFALSIVYIASARAATEGSFNPWDSAPPPFTFKYKGEDFSQFFSKWIVEKDTVMDRSSHGALRMTYVDPATELKVLAEGHFMPADDALDWTLYLKNNGTKDTSILENIQPLDVTLTVTGPVIVHHPHGSKAEPQDFMPQDDLLQPSVPLKFSSSDGRSSQGNMPFFNVAWQGGGVCGAIGWTGDWLATFTLSSDGKSVRMQAGQRQTHFVLHPGEEIRTARIALMKWQGNDWMVAQNAWRKVMLAHYTVQVDGRPLVGPISYGTWGADTAAHKLAQIALVKDEYLPFDNYWIDASWYDKCVGHDMGTDPNKGEAFWRGRGSWVTNPANYPYGLNPISNAAHDAGMRFLIWFEPEEADPGTILRKEHPDWFFPTNVVNNPGTSVIRLGDPAVRKGITNFVDKIITDSGLDWYRQDFNVNPRSIWAAADTPDRVGMTELQHIEGLYSMWDDLRARHPGLLIDNCASGGQRLDIETCSRSTPLWRSDMAGPPDDDVHNQTQTQGLALWIPVNGCCPWTAPGPFDESSVAPDPYDAKLIYTLRSGYSAAMVLGIGQAAGKDAAWCAKLRAQLNEYKEVQPYIYGDFYPLTPWSLAPDAQVAFQWDRPDKKSGVVIALRRRGCANGGVGVKLHAIDPDATYSVEIREGLDKTAPTMMRGSSLAGMTIRVEDQPGSALVFYRQK